ncbi:MAG: OmpH family outer membrane protein [Solirubrobacterales bacterium]
MCSVLTWPAFAQTTDAAKLTAPVVVIVDTSRIQREALAGKAITAQREKFQQSFQSEFEPARKQLQQQEMELAKQRSAMNPQTFEQKARAFEEEAAAFNRRTQAASRALDKSTATAHNELQRATIEVTSEVASELGAGLVLHKQTVFLHDPRMDVTDRIIERLNKRLPTVAFPPPELEAPAGTPTAPPKPGKK